MKVDGEVVEVLEEFGEDCDDFNEFVFEDVWMEDDDMFMDVGLKKGVFLDDYYYFIDEDEEERNRIKRVFKGILKYQFVWYFDDVFDLGLDMEDMEMKDDDEEEEEGVFEDGIEGCVVFEFIEVGLLEYLQLEMMIEFNEDEDVEQLVQFCVL